MKAVLKIDGSKNPFTIRSVTPEISFYIEGVCERGAEIDSSLLTLFEGETPILSLKNPKNERKFAINTPLDYDKDYFAKVTAYVNGRAFSSDKIPFSTPKKSLGGAFIMQKSDECKPLTLCYRFSLSDKKIKRARLFSTALGVYEGKINGKKFGDILSPGFTDYSDYVFFDTYDIKELLLKGENGISIAVGKGWYCGHNFLKYEFYGKKPLFRAEIKVEYEDGEKAVFATSDKWRYVENSPYIEADNLNGVTFDARKDLEFSSPSIDVSGYPYCVIANDENAKTSYFKLSDVRILPQMNAPVRIYDEIKPVIYKFNEKKKLWILDMKQNFAGTVRLLVRGKVGDKIVVRYAEMLCKKDKEETLYVENLRTAKATDVYIKGSDEPEIFAPTLTFHGFRYVEVSGAESLKDGDVTGLAFCTYTERRGYIETSSDDVNKIYSNVLWGQRSNFISLPTDCPQRDERAGWTGDAQVFSATATYNSDTQNFYEKYLMDVETGKNYNPYGAPTNYAPSLGNNLASPGWGDVAVVVPHVLYSFYGDKKIIERYLPLMQNWVDALEKHSFGHILYGIHSYGDWLSCADTSKSVSNTLCFANCAKLLSEMLKVIGKNELADKYAELFKNIKKAFLRTFVKKDFRIIGDSQSSYALCLAYGVAPEGKGEEIMAKRLVNDVRRRGNLLSSGFIGISKLCLVLSKYGYDDVAYDLLLQDKYPSWLYSIRNGATTIWERWNSYTLEKGFGPVDMNSFNHYSLGAVVEWAYRYMVGINGEPGFNKVVLRPSPDDRLSYVRGEYLSECGLIKSEWGLKGKSFKYEVTLPVGVTGRLFLIGKNPLLDGKPFKDTEFAKTVAQNGDITEIELKSGSYAFETEYTQKRTKPFPIKPASKLRVLAELRFFETVYGLFFNRNNRAYRKLQNSPGVKVKIPKDPM